MRWNQRLWALLLLAITLLSALGLLAADKKKNNPTPKMLRINAKIDCTRLKVNGM